MGACERHQAHGRVCIGCWCVISLYERITKLIKPGLDKIEACDYCGHCNESCQQLYVESSLIEAGMLGTSTRLQHGAFAFLDHAIYQIIYQTQVQNTQI